MEFCNSLTTCPNADTSLKSILVHFLSVKIVTHTVAQKLRSSHCRGTNKCVSSFIYLFIDYSHNSKLMFKTFEGFVCESVQMMYAVSNRTSQKTSKLFCYCVSAFICTAVALRPGRKTTHSPAYIF